MARGPESEPIWGGMAEGKKESEGKETKRTHE